MDKMDFEGSIILEKLAEVDLLEDFFESVDADNLLKVESLLREAEVDEDTIEEVLRQIEEGI